MALDPWAAGRSFVSLGGHAPSDHVNTQAQKRPQIAGVTLVEVMLAAALLAMSVVGMIQAVTYGSQMLDVSRKQTVAAQIIRTEIDKLHLTDWATVSGYSASATAVTLDPSFAGVANGFTVSRKAVLVATRTDFKKITFTVTWRGNTGRSYSRSGSTYFGKNGLYVTYRQ
jgi:Tfp pilus assembly protein PilV